MTILSAQNISVAIDGKSICHAFNIDLRAREVWGVLGPNGGGKTTLLSALAGLHSIQHGDVLLNQVSIRQIARKSLAQQIGFLFQDTLIHFPQSVYDYVAAGRFAQRGYFAALSSDDRQAIAQAIDAMSLTVLQHKRMTAISGGEKRRAAIAAVLAQTPQIYFLDEPANHLDIRYQHETLSRFRYLAKQQCASVVMSLHDPRHAMTYCDNVLMLFADGSHMQGNSREMLTAGNLMRLYEYSNNSSEYAQHSNTHYHPHDFFKQTIVNFANIDTSN